MNLGLGDTIFYELSGTEEKVNFKKLIKAQSRLVERVFFKPLKKSPRLVAGIDVAYAVKEGLGFAGVVVLELPEFKLIERVGEVLKVKFPYVPGFLSFREAPVMIRAFRKLKNLPEVLFVDGQGLAHPRKAGIAVHLGVILKIPTIGCAKKPLIKYFESPENLKGATKPIYLGKEQVGWILRTKKGVKPVFVSPGNLITLEDTLKLTLKCTTRYRLPEPIRLAHAFANELKKNFFEN